jgi:glycosyltransferase involved in cell wall biosynthesis
MPTYRQEAFLPRAVGSLLAQSMTDWELVVVDDGSPGDVPAALAPFRPDPRVRCLRLPTNQGLGAALNAGLDRARGELVAYLPSDDLYDRDHLRTLLAALTADATLTYSGIRHHGHATSLVAPPGHTLQLVQILHRAGSHRWLTRRRLESDDLERLFLRRACPPAARRATGRVTCTWTEHPEQRHKAIRERDDGGVNVFRRRFRVRHPLRLHSRDAGLVDEVALYRRFRDRSFPPPERMSVLLVGELAYNPERVLALAEHGVRLHGLWTPDGLGYHSVGPMPFGHVTDLPSEHWPEAVRRLDPDVIYAQLDWRAVPFAARVLDTVPEVPFVWHFKESPQRSIARGEWPALAWLCRDADAVLLSSPEERDWFLATLPGQLDPDRAGVLDGSLPKADWFAEPVSMRAPPSLRAVSMRAPPSPRAVSMRAPSRPPAARPPLSTSDGQVHTVVVGRPLGLDPEFVAGLAAHRVHLHCHGPRDGPGPDGAWRRWLSALPDAARDHVHLHPRVDQRRWRRVLSRYDAGWMHRFTSDNQGELARCTWDDLNYPARLGTYLVAGLPVLQPRADGSIVAMDRLVERLGIGLRYTDANEVAAALHDRTTLARARERVVSRRMLFSFDRHVPELIALFERLAGRPTRRARKRATTWRAERATRR